MNPSDSVDPLDLAQDEAGTRLRVRVRAGAKRDALLGVHAGALRVAVTAKPERGKANRAVLDLLAGKLDLRPGDLEILTGHGSRDKSVRVPLPPKALRSKLTAHLGR